MNPSNCLACLVYSGRADFRIRGPMPFVCTCDPPIVPPTQGGPGVVPVLLKEECDPEGSKEIVDNTEGEKMIEVASEIGFEGTSAVIIFPSFFYSPGEFRTEDDMKNAVNEHFRKNFDIFDLELRDR